MFPAVREMAKEFDLKSPFETNQPVSVEPYMSGRQAAAARGGGVAGRRGHRLQSEAVPVCLATAAGQTTFCPPDDRARNTTVLVNEGQP